MPITSIAKTFLAMIVFIGMITAYDCAYAQTNVLSLAVDDSKPSAPDNLRVIIAGEEFKDIAIKRSITHVQPMTGIVFWTTSDSNKTAAIQLEYAYMKYSEVVRRKGQFNWKVVDDLLNAVADRGHQAILRFYYVYPGYATTVPQYIKESDGYNETKGMSEDKETWFPDWSFAELRSFTLEFYKRFAERYDSDPRLAYLQVGFGLWAEYHIYDGPMTLGKTFPSKAFQADFIHHIDEVFNTLQWNISIDAADSSVGPFNSEPGLRDKYFGLFDDSFLHKTHHEYNADCFKFFNYQERHKRAPLGGELSYYTDHDQRHALAPNGPHGVPFEQLAAQYHISYMIGNDQPNYQSMARIEEAGMAIGYKFKVTAFKASASRSKVTVENTGTAPIYYGAYPTVNGVRATESLKGLLPGESKTYTILSGGEAPVLSIACDRLVSGQTIEFEADL